MTEPTEERPLVTFALFAYNQERFIREAVEGALAQTYSPLQVILSDDCSSDRTFAIMQEMVVDYSGPHEILLNRNERNLGIGGHVNRVMELAQGELIVVAAGDDMSLPERTETLVKVWLGCDKKTHSLHSSAYQIDVHSKIIGTIENNYFKYPVGPESFVANNCHVIGATHAWSSKIFEIFGPLMPEIIHEDRTIPLRAALLGEIKYINQPLVKYRFSGPSQLSHGYDKISGKDYLYKDRVKVGERYCWDFRQKLLDLKNFNASQKLCNLAENQIAYWELVVAFGRQQNRIKALVKAFNQRVSTLKIGKVLIQYMIPSLYVKYAGWRINKREKKKI